MVVCTLTQELFTLVCIECGTRALLLKQEMCFNSSVHVYYLWYNRITVHIPGRDGIHI